MSRFDLKADEASGACVPEPTAGLSVLVVGRRASRDQPLRRSLRQALAVVEFVEHVRDADRLLPRCHFDCVVVEVASATDPAIAWIDSLRGSAPGPSICVSGPHDPGLASVALRAGAEVVWPEPLEPRSLQRFLATRRLEPKAAAAAPTQRPLAPSAAARTRLVGESLAMRRVRSLVDRVAPTPATVLIEGHTGTGKELIARLVHERSGRRGPFVPVNCGAIPPELMETELFGHAKGAFTGAHQPREGLFVAARGGTLFLDEVSEMRSDLQVKLLRALEEGTIRPVGADRELPIDVRIVASSQPGLRERVHQRHFREDLFYRLNVVHILLPRLRDRREDIPALVEHFMVRVADEFGMPPVLLDDAQIAALASRDWGGNVRELRNVVERTVLMGAPPDGEPGEPRPAPRDAAGAYPVDWTLEQVKQAHIFRVLEHHGGNRSATARQLGVSRRTLERRLVRSAGDAARTRPADENS